MAKLTKNEKYIVEMYVRYFGKAPNVAEIAKYSDFKTPKKILNEIRGDADETKPLNDKDFVNSVFQNLFGRDAHLKEMNKYIKFVEKGKNLPINAIVKAAKKADKGVYDAKKAIAIMLAEQKHADNYNLDKITKYTYAEVYDLTAKKLLVGSVADLKTEIDAMKDNVSGTTFTLTASADELVGTEKGDVFNAYDFLNGAGTLTATLTGIDSLDGGEGKDTLNVKSDSAIDAVSATIKNIETINLESGKAIGATGAGAFDTTTFTGVETLNATKGTSAYLKAAATTDVNVSGITGTTAVVEVTGGKTVTVNHKMDSAGDKIDVNGAVNVNVTATDVIDTGAGTGINVGTGANGAVTGTVVVNASGKAASTTTATHTMEAIAVTGGTTVNVTQKATSDIGTFATTGTQAPATITQGDVNVTGTTDTTSVTVKQDAAVTAVQAVAAKAAVAATSTVTFKAMAVNETTTIDGLTFTASKALTAEQAAAAFANLTSLDAQANGGVTANGTYTGALTSTWTSGAATGATVVFSAPTSVVKPAVSGSAGTAAGAQIDGNAATTATTATAATLAKTGVLGVTAGKVVINDGGTDSITTVSVDGYGASSTIGATGTMTALKTVSLANSGTSDMTVKTTVATLDLNVNNVKGAVTLTDTSLKTLNITTATADSKFVLNTVTTVEALTVKGTNAIDLTGTTLSGLKTVVVSGTAGLTVDASAATVTSVDTTATTGTVTATIDASKATYTGGAGVDNVTTTTAAAIKAINLGAGDDKLTIGSGATAITAAIDGGTGQDTIHMQAADAVTLANAGTFTAKVTGFEKLSLGATAAAGTVLDLSKMNNINYVISENAIATTVGGVTAVVGVVTDGGAAAEYSTFDMTIPATEMNQIGESLTISGKTVTVNVAGTYTAAQIASAFAGTAVAGLELTGTATTPTDWTGTPIFTASGTNVVVTNTVVGNAATAFTASTGTVANATVAALSLTKMVNNGTLELTKAGAGVSVTMADATSTTADIFNIVTKVNTSDLGFGTVTVAGVETINITATDISPVNTTTNAATIQKAHLVVTANAAKTVTIDGNSDLNLTLTDSTLATMIDGSTMTGALTATTAISSAAATLKGGFANDTLTAAHTNDVIYGGAGNDTIIVGANAQSVTLYGGTGTDTFNVSAFKAAGTGSSIFINETVTSGDTIKFDTTSAKFNSTKSTVTDASLDAYITQAMTDAGGVGGIAWFQYAGNTYIVQDKTTVGFHVNEDTLVKIAGLVDLSTASFNASTATLEIA